MILLPVASHAQEESPAQFLWLGAGVVATTYLISETHDGPAIFAGVYSLGTLYLMNEWYENKNDYTDLIVPFSLLTLGVINIALFRNDDEYSKNDVFIYNITGLSLIAAYAWWEHKQNTTPNSSLTKLLPVLTNDYSGLLLTSTF